MNPIQQLQQVPNSFKHTWMIMAICAKRSNTVDASLQVVWKISEHAAAAETAIAQKEKHAG